MPSAARRRPPAGATMLTGRIRSELEARGDREPRARCRSTSGTAIRRDRGRGLDHDVVRDVAEHRCGRARSRRGARCRRRVPRRRRSRRTARRRRRGREPHAERCRPTHAGTTRTTRPSTTPCSWSAVNAAAVKALEAELGAGGTRSSATSCACGCSIDAPAGLPWLMNACAYRHPRAEMEARPVAERERPRRRPRARRARRSRRRARARR